MWTKPSLDFDLDFCISEYCFSWNGKLYPRCFNNRMNNLFISSTSTETELNERNWYLFTSQHSCLARFFWIRDSSTLYELNLFRRTSSQVETQHIQIIRSRFLKLQSCAIKGRMGKMAFHQNQWTYIDILQCLVALWEQRTGSSIKTLRLQTPATSTNWRFLYRPPFNEHIGTDSWSWLNNCWRPTVAHIIYLCARFSLRLI